MNTHLKFNIFLISILTIFISTNVYAEELKRVLVASPVKQKPQILKEFLQSLKELVRTNIAIDYYFIDDNDNTDSITALMLFAFENINQCIIMQNRSKGAQEEYVCNEATHYWKENIIWKVAAFKDATIQYAIQQEYDYLFLIDSDIVLHPHTLEHLIATQKDIISEIFWTSWTPGSGKQPQVWLYDAYTQYQIGINEHISEEEKVNRYHAFIQTLQIPGVYEVGGLGACTLMSKKALRAGISFKRIKNLTLWGEDRHFCVRAAALGIPLFVDTYYPAYHIYRESDLEGVSVFKSNNNKNQ